MSDRFTAETQYGDLQGSAAFDGHSGPPLHELAAKTDMPPGYFPIGLHLFRLSPDEKGLIHFSIAAVPQSEAKAAISAAEHGKIEAVSFNGRMRPADFDRVFKRIDVKITIKSLANREVFVSSQRSPT